MNALDLTDLTNELESYVAADGWDQPPRLFALVRTGELVASEPQLADTLGAADPDSLTPVEQDGIEGDIAELLSSIGWPPAVVGCALVNEVILLPPDAEAEMPPDVDAAEWASAHPSKRDVRIAVAVLRGGDEGATLRVRGQEGNDDDVVTGPGLVPNLSAALAETLTDEPADDDAAAAADVAADDGDAGDAGAPAS